MSSNVDHPDPEKVKEITGIEPAECPGRDETLSAIQNHKRDSLKKIVTVEKNSLPDKSQIEAEKRASVSDE
ncbi:hypothetical protein TCAL_00213 [Tigriopus californicus]|uniref:Uncharacterized protein n=1 Tax=Tigriopus californicus TaxID=6832 RepID=A0A553P3K7_TIGCA|nr:hypothetical protein TCAL_00213 [Tigriopus californicus]